MFMKIIYIIKRIAYIEQFWEAKFIFLLPIILFQLLNVYVRLIKVFILMLLLWVAIGKWVYRSSNHRKSLFILNRHIELFLEVSSKSDQMLYLKIMVWDRLMDYLSYSNHQVLRFARLYFWANISNYRKK